MKKRNRMSKLYWLIPLIVAVLWFAVGAKAGIVRNGSTVGEDSISVPLFVLDTAGNRVEIDTSADWGYIVTRYPNGVKAVSDSFKVSGYNTAKIVRDAPEFGGFAQFCYRKQISALDGTPVNGTYSFEVTVRDSSLKLWTVVKNGEFQLYQTQTFTAANDSSTVDRTSLSIYAGNFQAGAIDAAAIGTGAIDDDAVADGAIDFGGELDTTGMGQTIRIIIGDSLATFVIADTLANHIWLWAQANASITSAAIAADAIGSSELATTAVNEVVDQNWDEVIGGAHEAAGSSGELLIYANTAALALYTNGVKLLAGGTEADTSFTNLQTRLAAVRDSVNAILDTLQNHGADWGAGSGFSAADRDSMRDIVGDTARTYDATGGAAADIYPFNGIKLTIDAAGTDADAQFVVDTASLGGLSSHQATLVNRQLVIRSLSGIEVQIPTTINRVAYTAANCSLTVNVNMPINFAAGDTIQLAGWPWHDFATMSEAAGDNADSLLGRDTTGYGGDATIGGEIVAEKSDTSAQKVMLTNMGLPTGLDSLASLAETATSVGSLRRGEIVTARAAAETTSVILADDSLTVGGGRVTYVDSVTYTDTLGSQVAGAGGSCTGTGAIAFNLYFIDTLGTDDLVGDGHIALYTNSNCSGIPAYWGPTGGAGFVPFSVDTGTYWACASKMASVNATNAQYFHVTAAVSDSVLGYGFATSTRAVIQGIVQVAGGPDSVCAYCDVVFEMVTAGGNVRDTVLNTVVLPTPLQGFTNSSGTPLHASGQPFELHKTQNLVSTVGTQKYPVKWVMKVRLADGTVWQSAQFAISNATDVVDIGDL